MPKTLSYVWLFNGAWAHQGVGREKRVSCCAPSQHNKRHKKTWKSFFGLTRSENYLLSSFITVFRFSSELLTHEGAPRKVSYKFINHMRPTHMCLVPTKPLSVKASRRQKKDLPNVLAKKEWKRSRHDEWHIIEGWFKASWFLLIGLERQI